MDRLKQWIALTVVVVIGVLAAGWFLVVSPRRSSAADLRQQAAAKEQSNGELQTQVAVLKTQAKGLPAEQAKMAAVATKIPDNPAEPSLLRALSAAADQADVDLVTIAPGGLAALPTTSTASSTASSSSSVTTSGASSTATSGASSTAATSVSAGTTTAATGSSTTAAAGVLMMPVTITVAGGYYQIEQYLAALEDLPRAVRVSALTLAPGADPLVPAAATPATGATSTPDGKHLVATITASVFTSGTSASTPAVAPVATAAK